MANPVGWNSSWGEYKAGVNDFTTQINNASSAADKAAAEAARNSYLDSKGGSITDSQGTTYTKTYDYTSSGSGSGSGSGNNVSQNPTGSGGTVNKNNYIDLDKYGRFYDGTNGDMSQAAANAKAAGNTAAAYAIEQARNQYLADAKANGENIQWTPTNYYSPNTTTKVYTRNAGTVNVSVERDNQGNIKNVTSTSSAAYNPEVLDYIPIDDNQIAYYREDTGWTYGTNEDYKNYVSEYESAKDEQDRQTLMAEMQAWYDEQYGTLMEQIAGSIDTSTEASIEEIEKELDNTIAGLEQDAAEAYLQQQYNSDNIILQNAASGNTGGIAQKQYTSAQSAYDAQLLSIALTMRTVQNSAENTIAQLRANGENEKADAVSEIMQNKIAQLTEAYQWTQEMALQEKQLAYEQQVTDRNFAYQRALTMLEQGYLTTDAVEALGISEADAVTLRNQLNLLAQTDLSSAKQVLSNIAEQTTTLPDGAVLMDEVVDTATGKVISGAYKLGNTFYDANGNPLSGTYRVTYNGNTIEYNSNTGVTNSATTDKYANNPAKNDADMGRTLGNYSGTGIYQDLFKGEVGEGSRSQNYKKEMLYNAVDGMTSEEYQLAKGQLTSSIVNTLGLDGVCYYFSLLKNTDYNRADIIATLQNDVNMNRINESVAAGIIQALKITTDEWGGKSIKSYRGAR